MIRGHICIISSNLKRNRRGDPKLKHATVLYHNQNSVLTIVPRSFTAQMNNKADAGLLKKIYDLTFDFLH